ncbi:MAG: outer membrane protein assembly factor BamD [Phycisphaerae bacterium]|nr:outer membrane protein assembly factor BamD [Phycisphaerae bacterium]
MRPSCILALCYATVLTFVTAPVVGEHVWRDGQWVEAAPPAEGTPAGELALIRQYLSEDEPDDAADAAEEFLEDYPADPRCEEAMILWAQAERADGDFYDAFERYEAYLEAYPNGRYVERALRREYDIGVAFLEGRPRKALGIFRLPGAPDGVEILEKLVARAPRSHASADALVKLADYWISEGKHARAVQTCDQYLELFSDAPQTPDMMLKAARATYRAFQGVPHDPTPLLEAEQRFAVFIERYPERAEKAGAKEVLDEIRRLRAAKLMETAEFYRRVDRPESAIYYCHRVLERYPSTPSADEARAALKALGAPVESASEENESQ